MAKREYIYEATHDFTETISMDWINPLTGQTVSSDHIEMCRRKGERFIVRGRDAKAEWDKDQRYVRVA